MNCLLAIVFALVATAAFAQSPEPLEAPTPSKVAQLALESPRTQPGHYVRDILVLLDLGEGQFAKPLFDELAAMQLTDEQRAALVQEFGAAKIHRLARAEELGDGRMDFVRAVMQAAGQRSADPARLAKLIEQVASGDDGQRKVAMGQLNSAGQSAVTALLIELAKSDDQTRQNRLREALVRLAPLSTPALAAALDAPEPGVRQQAAWALGQIGDRASLPRLAALAAGAEYDSPVGKAARWSIKQMTGVSFNPSSAAPLLTAALQNTLAGVPTRRADSEGRIAVWGWDDKAQSPVEARLPADQAGVVHAARLASDLWELNEAQSSDLVQALALRLQGEWLFDQAGVASPQLAGPKLDVATGLQLNDALRLANERGYAGGVIALCQELGKRGVVEVLYSHDGQPTPLAAALDDPNPAARFAALELVMTLAPSSPFPGSSGVARALLHFAASDGAREAVVGMPKLEQAATVAGMLAGSGVQAAATNRGDEVPQLAARSADIEFVLLDLAILRPRAREVLFRLKRQPETAALPVALLAADGRLAQAQQVAREHDGVLAFARPHSAEAAKGIADLLQQQLPAGWPDSARRAEQATAAAGWIKQLLADGPAFYDLRGRSDQLLAAVQRTPDTAAAIGSLALVGTPDSQSELVNLANLDILPIATRDRAAAAFAQSVKNHGLLLTTVQIQAQYDLYNGSRDSDEDTQRVLGTLLDSIESNRDASNSARLNRDAFDRGGRSGGS